MRMQMINISTCIPEKVLICLNELHHITRKEKFLFVQMKYNIEQV